MSFKVTVTGHKNTKDGLESASFEAQVKDKAEAFVDEVKKLVGEDGGTVTATGEFGNIGQHDLVARKSATAETDATTTKETAADASGTEGSRSARRTTGQPERDPGKT